jgi:hypothetical protein
MGREVVRDEDRSNEIRVEFANDFLRVGSLVEDEVVVLNPSIDEYAIELRKVCQYTVDMSRNLI